jgi:hypothetical protein
MSNDDDAEATQRIYCPFFPFSIKGKHQVPPARPISTRSVHLNPLWPLSPKLTSVVLVASLKASIQPKRRHAHEASAFHLPYRDHGVEEWDVTARLDLPNVVSRFD